MKLNSLSPCVHALIICAVWNVNATDLASTSRKHSFHVSQNAAWRKIALEWMRIEPGHRSGSHRACARRSGLAEVPVRIRGGGGSFFFFFTSRQASKPRGSWALRIIANCGHLGSSLLFALGLSQLKETQRAEPRNAGKSVSFGSVWTAVDKQRWASPLRIATSHPATARVPRSGTSEAEFLDTSTGHRHTNTGHHSSTAIPHHAQCPWLSAAPRARRSLELCYRLKRKVWIWCALVFLWLFQRALLSVHSTSYNK